MKIKMSSDITWKCTYRVQVSRRTSVSEFHNIGPATENARRQ